MKPFYIKAFIIAIVYLMVFGGVFTLLQNKTVYEKTLGKISKNYERSGETWKYTYVQKVSKPYVEIKEQNFSHWDADIYHCISKQMYLHTESCYGLVSGAFFPLFPLIWKLIPIGTIGMSVLNYLLFIISLMILINIFLKTTEANKLLVFLLCIALPSTVVFMIPYTEALFMFTSALAFVGIEKRNYKLYFASSLAIAMVRPATLFVFLSLFLIECIVLLKKRNLKEFWREIFIKLSPFGLGYVLVIIIQFISSHSFTTYLDAQQHWSANLGRIKSFSDWSTEGYGLSVAAICIVAFPALFYSGYMVLKNKWDFNSTSNIFKGENSEAPFQYISISSFFYVIGLLFFTALVSGGNLHSFSRLILCTPAFYVILIYVFNKLQAKSDLTYKLLFFNGSLYLFFLFLGEIDFSGSPIDFSYLGSYLLVLNFLFFLFYSQLNNTYRLFIIIVLVLLNIIWNTFLLNSFLSDGWIFT